MRFKFWRDGGDLLLALFMLTAIPIGFAVGTVSCKGCGDESEPVVRAGEVDQPPEVAEEAQVATVFVENAKGKRIRVSGVRGNKGDPVVDNPEGRGVVKRADDELNVERLSCQVIIEAPIKPVMDMTEEGPVFVYNTANVPSLGHKLEEYSVPVLRPNSCTPGPAGLCFWSVLLRGQSCIDILDVPQYVGSSMAEFIALPPPKRARLLVQEGLCDDGEGGQYTCDVPFGDARAVVNGYVKVPNAWAGRDDLNFVQAKWDGAAVDVPPRYEVPR